MSSLVPRRGPAVAAAYGVIKAIEGADVCERQSGVLCGQHSINNLLQEKKIVSLAGNNNLFVSGPRNNTYTNPDGRCFSVIDMLRDPAIKINMKAVCALDNTPGGIGYCDRRTGFYADDSLEYVLNNLLRYDVEIKGTGAGITEPFDTWTTDVINRFRNDPSLIGILLNSNMIHWVCITRGLASCPPDRPNAYLDSQHPTEALCLSNDELLNFFTDKRASIRGYILVGYGSKGITAYNSVAKQAIETKRLAIVGAADALIQEQYNRFANYIRPITGINYVYGSGQKISDVLKSLKLSAAGPQTQVELARIATTQGFYGVINDFLEDYDGYPGAPATAIAASTLVARPKPPANITKASTLVAPPPPLVPAPAPQKPKPSGTTGLFSGLTSRLTSAIGLGTAPAPTPTPTPANNDERLEKFSKITEESINTIKAAYPADQLKKLLNSVIGTKAPAKAPVTVPVASAPVKAPITVPVTTPPANANSARQAAIKAKKQANIARAKKLGLFGGTRKNKRSSGRRQSRKNK